jgi:phage FluMu protein Com
MNNAIAFVDASGTWMRCWNCNHRLFKITKQDDRECCVQIEMKCPSCKSVNQIHFDSVTADVPTP